MLPDHQGGPLLRRLGHGHLVVEPGGGHQALLAVLGLAGGAGDHVAHAVHQPDGELAVFPQGDADRLLGHELGLGGHDAAAGAALRQLIPSPLAHIAVLDPGDHQGLHKTLDKGGLSGPDRAHHAQHAGSAGPAAELLIDLAFRHKKTPPLSWSRCYECMRDEGGIEQACRMAQ